MYLHHERYTNVGNLGTNRMGCNRRDLPTESQSKGALYDHSDELAS